MYCVSIINFLLFILYTMLFKQGSLLRTSSLVWNRKRSGSSYGWNCWSFWIWGFCVSLSCKRWMPMSILWWWCVTCDLLPRFLPVTLSDFSSRSLLWTPLLLIFTFWWYRFTVLTHLDFVSWLSLNLFHRIWYACFLIVVLLSTDIIKELFFCWSYVVWRKRCQSSFLFLFLSLSTSSSTLLFHVCVV